MKKTIAIIGESFGGTGKGLYPVEIAKSLTEKNKDYEIKLFLRDDAGYTSEFTEKIKTFKIKKRVLAGISYYLPLFFALKKDKSIDLIHAYDEKTSFLASFLKKPLIATICDLYPLEFNKFPMRNLFTYLYKSLSKCDKVITISRNTQEKLNKKFPELKNKTKFIHLGTDIKRFKPKKIKKNKITLGILCSEDKKLVNVFEKIILEYGNQIEIFLGGRDIPREFNFLKKYPQVIFKGFIKESELVHYYQNIDIFAYDTNIAAFELIPVEAMASGCAVVASKIGAIPEVLREGGLLAENNEKGFYDSIKKLIEDKNLRIKYKKAGRKRAEELSWDNCAKNYAKTYGEIFSKN